VEELHLGDAGGARREEKKRERENGKGGEWQIKGARARLERMRCNEPEVEEGPICEENKCLGL
jgi:hypothetical protein